MLRFLPLLSSLLALKTVSSCPDNWVQSGTLCYLISTKPMDWGTAQEVRTEDQPEGWIQCRLQSV